MKLLQTVEQKARARAQIVITIWSGWSDEKADLCDDALEFIVTDIWWNEMPASPLGTALDYFANSYRNDINPKDLTIDQMVEELRTLCA